MAKPGKVDEGVGRVKEAAGAVLDDELRAEGKVDQATGKRKQTVDRGIDKGKARRRGHRQPGGWQRCRRLKADPRTRAAPVIMMTADLVETEDAEYGLALGADEYLVKPFVLDVFLYNVVRLLEGPAPAGGPAPGEPPPAGD